MNLKLLEGGSGVKSFSLSGSAASQLSQSVRERLMLGSQSLPKPGSHDFAVLFQHHRYIIINVHSQIRVNVS